VASANVDGGKIRQITVNLNRDLLYSKGISVTEVARAVNDSNFLLPSGDVKLGSLDYNVFTNNQFSIVDPMENIVVRRFNGTPIRVRDVGRVEDSAETQQSVVRVNGEKAVYLRVNKQPGANTVEVVDAVKRTLPNLLGLPPGVSVNLTFDQSTYIRQSIQSLWHEASIGQTFGLRVTADELATLGAAIDAILRPYIALTREDAPPDAQPVHVSLTAFRHPLP